MHLNLNMKKAIISITFMILLSVLLTGCKREGKVIDNSDNSINNADNMTDTIDKIEPDKYCESKAGQKACPAEGEEIAVIETNYGDIKIKFFQNEAPNTVTNFKKLIHEGFYDSLIFHRIIKAFMVQGQAGQDTLSQQRSAIN
jgi:hypothetical protein